MLNNYDALFIFNQSMDEENIERALTRLGEEITRLNGIVEGTETIGKRTFARPMDKQTAGTYVRLKVQLEPDRVEPLLSRLKLNEDVFRVQIIRRKEVASADSTKTAAVPADEEKGNGES